MKKRIYPLATILMSALMVITLSSLLIFALVSVNSFNAKTLQASEESTIKSVRQSTITLANQITSYKQEADQIVNTLLNSRTVTDYQEVLQQAIAIQTNIEAILLTNQTTGQHFYAPRYLPLKPFSTQAEENPYFHLLYQQTATFSVPHIQPLFRGHYPWVITYTTPLKLENTDYLLSIDYNIEQLTTYFKQATIGNQGYTFIVDVEDKLVYHPQQQVLSSVELNDLEVLKKQKRGIIFVADTQKLYGSEMISFPQWRVVGVSFLADSFQESQQENLYFVISIMIIIGSAVLLLSLVTANFIARPLVNMSESLKGAKATAFSDYTFEQQFIEIESLSNSYNGLLDEIKQLMRAIKKEQEMLRKSEQNALQAQINPHFLYNTLDSILWMCQTNNSQGAATMVNALGKLMRLSLSDGQEFITLREEIQHAENYLIIQKIRYGNDFNYRIELDESLLDYRSLKLIIQPFIENAINHGFNGLVDPGELVIQLLATNNEIKICISDNGLGITPDIVTAINQYASHPKLGIGIQNVSQRIDIYFGMQYGVTIASELDVGTTAIVTLPKFKESWSINEK